MNPLSNMKASILNASLNSGEGHIPSAFSVLDILYCIYLEDGESFKTKDLNSFLFILSKGHAALALYALLGEIGLIEKDWYLNFCSEQSNYGGHPDVLKVPHANASTGSLGHGLPISVGKVLADRINGKKRRIICLIGDGEMNEGTIWESSLLASHHKMNELTLIVDNNLSTDRALALGNIGKKFDAFDFEVSEIDGHNHHEIREALKANNSAKPKIIVANTIKGFGLREMENNPAWHHLSPTIEQMTQFLSELT